MTKKWRKLLGILLLFVILISPVRSEEYFSGKMVLMIDTLHMVEPSVGQDKIVNTGLDRIDRLNQTYGASDYHLALRKKVSKRGRFTKLYNNSYIVSFYDKSLDMKKVSSKYQTLSTVKNAYPVWKKKYNRTPDDSLYDGQWYLEQVKAHKAWNTTTGSEDIVMVALDSGLDWKHPEIAPRLWQNLGEDADGDGHTIEKIDGEWAFDPGDLDSLDNDYNGKVDDLIGWDFVTYQDDAYSDDSTAEDADSSADNNPMDFYLDGHGTMCSGIMAAASDNGRGIAGCNWNTKLMAVRTGYYRFAPESPRGHEGVNSPEATYPAMNYVMDQGVDVINLSWGSNRTDPLMDSLCVEAWEQGIVIIGGAGNDNVSHRFFPANYPTVMSVAATNRSDRKARFSNYGNWIEVSAPGTGMLSTRPHRFGNYYAGHDGTSFSSPLVAGIAGLLFSAYQDSFDTYPDSMGPDTLLRNFVYNRIIETADSIDDENPTYEGQLGSGRVNAFMALSRGVHPYLSTKESHATDSPSGDGRIDPGESGDIWITFENSSDTIWEPATRCTLVISTPDPYVEITDERGLISDIALGEQGSNESDPVSITVDSSSPPHYVTINYEVRGANSFSLPGKTEFLIGRPIILLYDDDQGTFHEYEEYFTPGLDDLGIPYEVHHVDAEGHLSAENLKKYKNILWFTANKDGGSFTSSRRNTIKEYLNEGNNLILTGQYITNELKGTDLMQDYFGDSVDRDSVGTSWGINVIAVPDNPISDVEDIDTISTVGAANNQDHMSTVDPLHSSPFYRPTIDTSTYFATYYSPDTANFKTVFSGIGFEGINGMNTRKTLIRRIMKWTIGSLSPPDLSLSLHQNPAFSQYANIIITSDVSLYSAPTLYVEKESDTSKVEATHISSSTYRGDYEFTSEGDVTLKVYAIGENTLSNQFTRTVNVEFINSTGSGYLLAQDDRLEIDFPKGVVDNGTYFTLMTKEGGIYSCGPRMELNKEIKIKYHTDNKFLNLQAKTDSGWINLPTKTGDSYVVASTDYLTDFRLKEGVGADQSNSGDHRLLQISPNPFTHSTDLTFSNKEEWSARTSLELSIYDLKGRKIKKLYAGSAGKSPEKFSWDGTDQSNHKLPAGVYLCKLEANNHLVSQSKVLLIK